MFLWTIKWVILSLIIIAISHNLYSFAKMNMSTPHIRDLANERKQEYEIMQRIIDTRRVTVDETKQSSAVTSTDDSMKEQLKMFMSDISSDISSDTVGGAATVDTGRSTGSSGAEWGANLSGGNGVVESSGGGDYANF